MNANGRIRLSMVQTHFNRYLGSLARHAPIYPRMEVNFLTRCTGAADRRLLESGTFGVESEYRHPYNIGSPHMVPFCLHVKHFSSRAMKSDTKISHSYTEISQTLVAMHIGACLEHSLDRVSLGAVPPSPTTHDPPAALLIGAALPM